MSTTQGTDGGETVADRVAALRGRLGISQKTLATKTGLLDREEISKIERGANQASTGRVREALAVGFGLPLEQMFAFLDGKLSVDGAVALIESRKPNEPARAS